MTMPIGQQYIGVRRHALDTIIFDTADPDEEKANDEDFSVWEALDVIITCDDASEAVRDLLEQAYDIGYRMGTHDTRKRAL